MTSAKANSFELTGQMSPKPMVKSVCMMKCRERKYALDVCCGMIIASLLIQLSHTDAEHTAP